MSLSSTSINRPVMATVLEVGTDFSGRNYVGGKVGVKL
jgi:hypothetical protein